MLYFVDVFYNMKCLRNTYFVGNILLNMKQMLVFIFIIFFFFGFKFWPLPGMNPGSVPDLKQRCKKKNLPKNEKQIERDRKIERKKKEQGNKKRKK